MDKSSRTGLHCQILVNMRWRKLSTISVTQRIVKMRKKYAVALKSFVRLDFKRIHKHFLHQAQAAGHELSMNV